MNDIDLYGFTVADSNITVYCGSAGMSWGFSCNHKVCEKRSYIGWDNAADIAGGAAAHLIWHANGEPECKHCGGTLSSVSMTAGECPPGECSERDAD